jgi:predicted acyltransferase (DUF342 family)
MIQGQDEARRLSDLLAASPATQSLADSGEKPRLLEAMRVRYWRFFEICLEDQRTDWKYHRGDIQVDGDLLADEIVFVDGDLQVSGSVYGVAGMLVVLGSFRAKNVITCWSLAALGPVVVEGMLFVHYNDHVFRAGDVVRARAFIVDDMDASYPRGKLEVEAYISDQAWNPEQAEAACRVFVPELVDVEKMMESIEEHSRDDPFLKAALVPDSDVCWTMLKNGEPIFRDEAPPAELTSWIMGALESGADGDEGRLRSFVGRDPLVDRIVDAYETAFQSRIPRTTPRMRAVAADRAKLGPTGADLHAHCQSLDEGVEFTGVDAFPALAKRIEGIQHVWIRSDCNALLEDCAENAVVVQGDVNVTQSCYLSATVIIDGDLSVEGALFLAGGALLVTGTVAADQILLDGSLHVLGALSVQGALAGRARTRSRPALHVLGAFTAQRLFLDGIYTEFAAGDPTSKDSPGPDGDWTAETLAVELATLAPEVLDFEALLEDVYPGDEELPEVEPRLKFPAAWDQVATHGTLLRSNPPSADFAAQLLKLLLAVHGRSWNEITALRSSDPLFERIAVAYAHLQPDPSAPA